MAVRDDVITAVAAGGTNAQIADRVLAIPRINAMLNIDVAWLNAQIPQLQAIIAELEALQDEA